MIRVYDVSESDRGLIKSLIGEEYFSGARENEDLSLIFEVDGIAAKRLIDYWNENDCAFNLRYMIKNRRKS